MCAKESMGRMTVEVKGLPHYASEGEVIISNLIKKILSFFVDCG